MSKQISGHIFKGAERAACHTLIYNHSPEVWADGFPLGNGQFGGLLYQPEETVFEFAFTHLGVWKHRVDIPAHIPFPALRRAALENPNEVSKLLAQERYTQEHKEQSGFKPCGRLRLSLDDWIMDPSPTLFDKRMELHLDEALVRGSYELAGKAMRYEAFVDYNTNVAVFHLEDTYLHPGNRYPYTQNLKLYRLFDPEAEIIRTGIKDGIGFIEFGFREKNRFLMAFKVSGVETGEFYESAGEVSMQLFLPYATGTEHRYDIFITVQLDDEGGKDLFAAAKADLEKAAVQHNSWRKRTVLAWERFWNQSGICLENEALEGLWYMSLYQLAASARGPVAPGLFGLWNAIKSAPWRGDYNGDINMAMTYWPMFNSNHAELTEGLFTTVEKMLPKLLETTRRDFGVGGIHFPLACGPEGDEMGHDCYRLALCTTGFYAGVYLDYLHYCQPKREVIEKRIFPTLEGCSRFYADICIVTASGKLLLGPSWAPEQGPCPAWNVANDIALIRPLWEGFLEVSELLGISGALQERIEELLPLLPEPLIMNGEIMESESAEWRAPLCHPSILSWIFPGEEIDADSSMVNEARKTLFNYLHTTERLSFAGTVGSACDLTWCWLFVAAIRLREAHFASHVLMDIAIADFLKPNGMFAYIGGKSFATIEAKRKAYTVEGAAPHAMLSQTANIAGRERTMSMLQQASAFIFGINETMLQSQNGEVKIFPCLLDIYGFSVSFHRLRARPGVLVSAACDRQGVSWITLEPERDMKLNIRLFDDCNRESLDFYEDGQLRTAQKIKVGTYTLELTAGKTCCWQRDGSVNDAGTAKCPPPEPGIRSFGKSGVEYPVQYGKKLRYC